MTIWKLSYQHNEYGNCVSYHPTKRQAVMEFRDAEKQAATEGYDVCNPSYQQFDFRCTTPEIIEFLNRFTPHRDNG